MTKEKKVEELIQLQDVFNSKLDHNWRHRGWDWDSCITAEIGEALESLQFKHWKKQELDLENAKVELIDILHFHMSKDLEVFARVTIKKSFVEHFSYFAVREETKIIRELLNEYNVYRTIKHLVAVMSALGMDFNEVYKRYIIKNVLNIFRQSNGYKDGSYIKIWDGIEDNKVALAQYEDSDTFDSLYSKLEERYKEISST